jgi:N6-L-threonylcarbamoyladenine synthase
MLVLGIESTCDETSASIVKNGHEILSNIVASQVDIHKKFGGVFPELACRSHVDMMIPIIDEAIKESGIKKTQIDLIAVAKGPGLLGALLIGMNTAKALSLSWNKPFIGVNHVEAHLYAAMMNKLNDLQLPALGCVISGGHTMLIEILKIGEYKLIGSTVDDAIGEAFDKVANILELPYPGGPNIENLAKKGDPEYFDFKPAVVKKSPFDFSFSGLKTKVLYTVKGQSSKRKDPLLIASKEKKHIAASFQKAAFTDIIEKSKKAIERFNLKALYLGGGVSNNKKLKEMFLKENLNLPIFFPPKGLSLDNAAMIAGLGFQKFKEKPLGDFLSEEVFTRAFLF